jgi:TetR/AcrR family transcriptional repressor of nem operon
MRYEPEHKARTRERIVRNAARKLRVEGLSGLSVASIMKASGLTVGGFYRHFRSKDELVTEAIAHAFSHSEKIYSSLQNLPREERWKEIVRWYLSPEQCDHADTGCPVAALAPEIARTKLGLRKRIADLMKDRSARWMDFMPGATAAKREQDFCVIFSAIAGAISMVRIITERADRERVLTTMRDHLLHSF